MGPVRALLLFPVRPAAAARALRPAASALLLLPPLLLFLFLWGKGCGAGDAGAAAAGLLLMLLGLGLGGALVPAQVLLQHPLPRRIVPCLVLAAWTPLVLLLVLAAARLLGAGLAAALAAGLFVLVWGVLAGIGVLAGEEEDRGRALVASCAGASGALLGFTAAALLVRAVLVLAVPLPAGHEELLGDGDLLLVRREAAPAPGAVVLLVAADSREAALARMTEEGAAPLPTPRGAPAAAGWPVAGRVFFRLGGAGGGAPVAGAG